MKLIDVDELKKKLEAKHCDCELIQIIDDMPTIDAEPVKYGTWLPHKITASVKCSNCRRVFPDETPRCPNCGARMDGDNND